MINWELGYRTVLVVNKKAASLIVIALRMVIESGSIRKVREGDGEEKDITIGVMSHYAY